MSARTRNGSSASATPTLALMLLTGGLGYGAWQAEHMPIDTSPVAMTAAGGVAGQGKTATGAGLAVNDPPPPNLLETTARPLFNPLRRPIVVQKAKVVETAPAPPVQPLKAELIGLAATDSSRPLALLRIASDRPASWLSVGEEVGGWRLSEIRPDRVVFQSGEQRQELQLFPVRGKVRRIQ